MAGLYGVLGTGVSIYMSDTALLDLQQEARNGMERMTRELRESNQSVYTNGYAGNGRVIFSTPNEASVQYYLNNNQLMREYPLATTAKPVAQNITSLQFAKSGTLMTVSLQAQKSIYHKTLTFSLAQKVRLRNE